MTDDPEEGMDALARLRAANPLPPDEVAALSSSARARALRAEIVMQTESSHSHETPEPTQAPVRTSPRWQRQLVAGLALVLLAVAGTVAALQLTGDAQAPGSPVADGGRVGPEAVGDELPDDTVGDELPEELVDPVPGEQVDPMPGGGLALCVAMYSPQTLAEREFAFAGTVTGIDGDTLAFEVEESFRGDHGEATTVGGAEFLTMPNPDNAAPIAVGDRLLVAGDGEFAWGCGFTQPYDEAVAAQWRTVLGG